MTPPLIYNSMQLPSKKSSGKLGTLPTLEKPLLGNTGRLCQRRGLRVRHLTFSDLPVIAKTLKISRFLPGSKYNQDDWPLPG